MANYAYLVGCPSREAAASEDRTNEYYSLGRASIESDGWGPGRFCGYALPLYWLACFARADEITLRRQFEEWDLSVVERSVMGLWVETGAAANRLRRRRDNLLALMPAPLRQAYGDLADAFAAHLLANYPHGLLLDATEVLAMTDLEEGARSLRGALDALEQLEGGQVAPRADAFVSLSIVPEFGCLAAGQAPDDAPWKWRNDLVGEAGSEAAWIATAFPPTSAEAAYAGTLPHVAPA